MSNPDGVTRYSIWVSEYSQKHAWPLKSSSKSLTTNHVSFFHFIRKLNNVQIDGLTEMGEDSNRFRSDTFSLHSIQTHPRRYQLGTYCPQIAMISFSDPRHIRVEYEETQ
jgi:hypothetical protein